jgi:hypothetical protein
MKSIETQRREMQAKGIDPDCMPDGYWQKVAQKRRRWKEYKRQCIAITKQEGVLDRMEKRGCKDCEKQREEKQLAKLKAQL